jgi:hypothetical protein
MDASPNLTRAAFEGVSLAELKEVRDELTEMIIERVDAGETA